MFISIYLLNRIHRENKRVYFPDEKNDAVSDYISHALCIGRIYITSTLVDQRHRDSAFVKHVFL